jgi:hypothetical protein
VKPSGGENKKILPKQLPSAKDNTDFQRATERNLNSGRGKIEISGVTLS